MTYIKVAKDIRQNRKNSKYIVRIHTAWHLINPT